MENINTRDVADYIASRTKDYEISPPDHIWENIESALNQKESKAKYSHPLLNNKSAFIAGSIIIVAALILLFFPFDNSDTSKGLSLFETNAKREISLPDKQLADNEIIVSENVETVIAKPSEQSKPATEIAVPKPTTIEKKADEARVPKKADTKPIETYEITTTNNIMKTHEIIDPITSKVTKRKEYWMNVSGTRNVDFICFFNKDGKEVIRSPKENNVARFFPIDISTLPNGVYTIKLLSGNQFFDYKVISITD